MSERCFFCGAAAAEGEDPHSALCPEHQAIRQHPISMQRESGERLTARCGCGWAFFGRKGGANRPADYAERERAVKAHWLLALSGTRPIHVHRCRPGGVR